MLSSRSIVLKLFGSAALVFVLSHLLAAAASGVAFEIPRPSNEVNTRSDQGSNLQRGQTPVNVRSATRFDRDITGEKKKEAFPDLYEASIDELQAGLIRGDFTSADLVKVSRLRESRRLGGAQT